MPRLLAPFAVALAGALLVVGTARADLDGQQACLDREAGSSCTRSSGDIGTCRAEPTVPGVLTCVPDGGLGGAAGASGSGVGGGNASAGSAGYVGTGTGAQGGSVDGPACSVISDDNGARDRDGVVAALLVGGAIVLGRRRR